MTGPNLALSNSRAGALPAGQPRVTLRHTAVRCQLQVGQGSTGAALWGRSRDAIGLSRAAVGASLTRAVIMLHVSQGGVPGGLLAAWGRCHPRRLETAWEGLRPSFHHISTATARRGAPARSATSETGGKIQYTWTQNQGHMRRKPILGDPRGGPDETR